MSHLQQKGIRLQCVRARSAIFITTLSCIIVATGAAPAQAITIKWGDKELTFDATPIVDGIKYVVNLFEQIASSDNGFSLVKANTRLIAQETPTQVSIVYSGLGAVSKDESIPLSFVGDYWDFNATLNVYDEADISGTADDADRIILTSSSLIHKADPLDGGQPHDLAEKLSLDVNYTANESLLEPGNVATFSKETIDIANHAPHSDQLFYSRLEGTVSRDASSIFFEEDWQIEGFAYDLRAGHAVPGPLPVFGVAAVFGYSRKLRKRVRNSKLPVSSAID